jgi:hypothetical protein
MWRELRRLIVSRADVSLKQFLLIPRAAVHDNLRPASVGRCRAALGAQWAGERKKRYEAATHYWPAAHD